MFESSSRLQLKWTVIDYVHMYYREHNYEPPMHIIIAVFHTEEGVPGISPPQYEFPPRIYKNYDIISLKALSHNIKTIFSILRAGHSYHTPLIEKS